MKILPAYLANTGPLVLKPLDFLKLSRPLDGGRNFMDGRRVFGDGKTWYGLLTFLLVGTLTGAGLAFTGIHTWLTGLVLGFGAFLGDLGGSFLKRRLGMKRGQNAGLLDREDFITGAILLSLPLMSWSLPELILVYALTPVIHKLSNTVGYLLKIKEVPW